MTTFNFWLKLNKPILALAPMAGISDSAFRQICRQSGADVVYSEMTSADGLFHYGKKTLDLLKFDRKEQPLVIQLFGKDPSKFGPTAQLVEQAGASGIDINFGCPARKVVAHGGGATLMRDLNLCRQIIKEVIENTNLPVSVKVRISINYQGKKNTIIDFLKKMADLPISAVMIHGRTYEQGFSGEIDYQTIKEARKHFKGVILANGGINAPEEAKNILKKTAADGLGLARGVYGRPWLFNQIKDYLNKGLYREPSWLEKKKIILEHAKLAFKAKSDHGLLEFRKHLLWYVKGLPEAKNLRSELVKIETIEEIKKVLKKIHE
jgi:tRNA-dihydrouridine synthase B